MKYTKTCPTCGDTFETHKERKIYCCRQCYVDSVAADECVCQRCGKTYTPKRPTRNKYCSRECAFADNMGLISKTRGITPVWVNVCVVCGKHVDGVGKYCSDECAKEGARRYAKEIAAASYVAPTYTCKECGKEFSPEYGDKRRAYCSAECTKKHRNRIGAKSTNGRARRVLREIYDNWREHYQPINKGRVFKRDGYRCQKCGCKVKRTKFYHPQQATIDHIVPLSKGGDHTYANVQTLCQECNVEKGAKIEGQLRFGWA